MLRHNVVLRPFWSGAAIRPLFLFPTGDLVSVGNKGLISPLESALTEFSPANSFRIRTYKKHRGRGGVKQKKAPRLHFPSCALYISDATARRTLFVLHRCL